MRSLERRECCSQRAFESFRWENDTDYSSSPRVMETVLCQMEFLVSPEWFSDGCLSEKCSRRFVAGELRGHSNAWEIGSCREKPYSPNSPLCFCLIKHVLWVLCVRLPVRTCTSFAYVNCNTGLALLLCTSQKIGLRRHILNQLLKPAWKSQKFLTKFKTINQLCSNLIE